MGRQEEHLTCKNEVMRCWCRSMCGSRCRLFAYGPADAAAYQNFIISCLMLIQTGFVLPFWYRLTQVVLEKRPLNGCSSSYSEQRVTSVIVMVAAGRVAVAALINPSHSPGGVNVYRRFIHVPWLYLDVNLPVPKQHLGRLYGWCGRLFVSELNNEYFTRQIF